MTTEKADLIFASLPYRIMHEFQIPVYDEIRERDADFYDRLDEAGFLLDFGDDGSGLFMKYLRRGSGYYIDVGASRAGRERRHQAEERRRSSTQLTENAVVLTDGTELPADLVVYATGYGSMNGWAARPDLAGGRRQGRQGAGVSARTRPRTPVRGRASSATCGSRPSRRRSGSTAATCTSRATTRCTWRCSSRPATDGIDTPVYGLQEVHHTS